MMRSSRCIPLLIWAVGAVAMASLPAQSAAMFRVAIMDFQNSTSGKFTAEEVLSLSDMVRVVAPEVLPRADFLLMTRDNIQQLLPPDKTLAECLGECAVETGRKIGADYVVTGEVVMFQRQPRVTLTLHETRQGNLIGSTRVAAVDLLSLEKDLPQESRDLLLGIRKAAEYGSAQVTRDDGASSAPHTPWTATGTSRVVVSFSSEPAGAIVEIDGQPIGETPCRRALLAGVYRLGIKKVKYVAHEQTIEVRAGTMPPLNVVLVPDFGWLTITSDPEGLDVVVDGDDWGRTPVRARELSAAVHDVQVGSANHYPEQRQIALGRGAHQSVVLAPVPRNGGITVAAVDGFGNAAEGRVLVDGIDVGRVYEPLTVIQGTHVVEVASDGGAWKGQVAVVEGQLQEIDAPLSPMSTVVDLVAIPAGDFAMGSPVGEVGRDIDEVVHEVHISHGFYLSATEITQAQFQKIMKKNPSYFRGESRPVERVSWLDAVEFCNALSRAEGLGAAYRVEGKAVVWDESSDGYRLPTEAEWEYACRSHGRGAYSTGNSDKMLSLVDWYSANSDGQTHDVTSKTANAWGLFGMQGNVYEWCWDWYGQYAIDMVDDPQGPAAGAERVFRGGSWFSAVADCRSADRGWDVPTFANKALGFRVARGGHTRR